MRSKGWALWFTGLPGSGKSTLVDAVRRAVDPMQERTVVLRMDERRKAYFPSPTYSEAEREQAYKMFVDEAAFYVLSGKGVFMDASAHRLSMRQKARGLIPRFAEVYLRCNLDTAMQREAGRPEGAVMAGLYSKALERKRTGRLVKGLGEVIGVDVPFEEDPAAECVVMANTMTLEEARDYVLEFLLGWLPG
ncbi:MAG: adenylyl-sulfate kinase [Desulfovibrio sp.]|uniref:adenylyl-sulfate kinase n=1 Tax=Desulfovibrio sp. 7SRBS1 TaxID=3378064 RepID=UPI003B3F8AAE